MHFAGEIKFIYVLYNILSTLINKYSIKWIHFNLTIDSGMMYGYNKVMI